MDVEAWRPVIAEAEVTVHPRAVVVDDVPLVLLRTEPAATPVAFYDRCPHRLVALSAGQVTQGRLRCAYHGWEFGVDGRCGLIPSAGPQVTPPPRADLLPGPRTRIEAGLVWVQAADLAGRPEPTEALLTNSDPRLGRAWHPVGLSTEIGPNWTEVHLLGRPWSVRRTDALAADPSPYGICERWGLVWLAPQRPLVELFTEPDAEDAAYVGAWLPPARTGAPAGFVADNFLDVAHFPFVHTGTFGAAEEKLVAEYEVTPEPDGCRSVQEQWFDNPGDPGVAAGIRPVRQRRRATYVYRAPFQLLLRLSEVDAGAVKTILFFVQPESESSTRIYTKMLLYGIGGVARPGPDTVAAEVAFEEAVLAEDLALQRAVRLPGLPLRMADELHVRADRLGVTLRRCLTEFLSRAGGTA